MKRTFFVLLFLSSFLWSQDLTSQAGNDLSLASNVISVTIGGDFVITGTFPSSTTERVDEFVTRLYNETRQAELSAARTPELVQVVIDKFSKYSKRGIKLIHKDGTSQIVDLEKFRLTGDYKYNPYLQYEDVLIFPPYNIKTDFVEISGAVNKHVTFQYVDGDTFGDALIFAHGFNPAYEKIDYVEISRLSDDGRSEQIIKISPDSLDFRLHRADRIRVVADASMKRNFKVLVLGEVNKPGYVFITKDNTTIRQVIENAGGFKPTADLVNSRLIRGAFLAMSELDKESYTEKKKLPIKKNTQNPLEQLFDPETNVLQMQRMADIIPEDSVVFIADNKLRLSSAQGGVDFTKIFVDSLSDGNFIVKDGDVIVIPEKTNLVYVYGQVMNPGYIEYKPGAKYDYYIKKTGGLGNRAKSEIYLIKGKSNAWIDMTDTDDYKIESGDFIWVPKDVPRNFDFYLKRTAQIASIIAATATVILIFKK